MAKGRVASLHKRLCRAVKRSAVQTCSAPSSEAPPPPPKKCGRATVAAPPRYRYANFASLNYCLLAVKVSITACAFATFAPVVTLPIAAMALSN